MNYTSIQLMASLNKLEATIENKTPQQQQILDDLRTQIRENGRFYEVGALTLESMREHGYDVSEKDAGIITKIAEKTEIDPEVLWGAVEVWANYYGIKQIED